MTPDGAIESYLTRLRSELLAAGANDVEDVVAEIRGLLEDASAGDLGGAEREIARLGPPAELARDILAERGLDDKSGIASGLWWRLGIAAPIDIAIGVALPLAAVLPLYLLARVTQPRLAGIALALALGVVALAWPFFVWRPWRSGGRTLTPGMALTGLAVVRTPGSWRLVPLSELAAAGLAPRRRLAASVAIALIHVVLLAGTPLLRLGGGQSWLASVAALTGANSEGASQGLTRAEARALAEKLYGAATDPRSGSPEVWIAPDALDGLGALQRRVRVRRSMTLEVGQPQRLAEGVYRVDVRERLDRSPVVRTTLTFGRRSWLTERGPSTDWVVVRIEGGLAGPE